jgi:hypothetical protein
MTAREDVKYDEPELAELGVPETGRPATAGREPVGRIVHDERGNARWKWGEEEDTSTSHTTSDILKHLDPQDLKVQGNGPGGSSASRTPVFDAGGGYDPYNQGAPPKTKPWTPKKGSTGKR